MVRGRGAVPQRHSKARIKDLACKFGNLSIGAERCSIGVKFERASLLDCLQIADEELCGARINATLKVDPSADQDVEGQQKLPGVDTSVEITSVADVKGLNVRPDAIAATLAFARAEFDDHQLGRLSCLSQKTGRLTVERVGDADGDGEE